MPVGPHRIRQYRAVYAPSRSYAEVQIHDDGFHGNEEVEAAVVKAVKDLTGWEPDEITKVEVTNNPNAEVTL